MVVPSQPSSVGSDRRATVLHASAGPSASRRPLHPSHPSRKPRCRAYHQTRIPTTSQRPQSRLRPHDQNIASYPVHLPHLIARAVQAAQHTSIVTVCSSTTTNSHSSKIHHTGNQFGKPVRRQKPAPDDAGSFACIPVRIPASVQVPRSTAQNSCSFCQGSSSRHGPAD